jgi:hypothetical protein
MVQHSSVCQSWLEPMPTPEQVPSLMAACLRGHRGMVCPSLRTVASVLPSHAASRPRPDSSDGPSSGPICSDRVQRRHRVRGWPWPNAWAVGDGNLAAFPRARAVQQPCSARIADAVMEPDCCSPFQRPVSQSISGRSSGGPRPLHRGDLCPGATAFTLPPSVLCVLHMPTLRQEPHIGAIITSVNK